MTSTFIVPWKREGTSKVEYTFTYKDNSGFPYVCTNVSFIKKGKRQHMVATVMYRRDKPKQFENALKLVGKTFTELPTLK